MTNTARLCCCQPCCPATRTVHVVGTIPVVIGCPSNIPSSIGEFYDCDGSISNPTYSVYSYVHSPGVDCYFDPTVQFCAGTNQIWPLFAGYSATRTACPGFSTIIGQKCGNATQIGAAPTATNGATAGWTAFTVSSSYNTILSAHQVSMEILVPTWYEPLAGIWYWSTHTIRVYNYNTNRGCFPVGDYEFRTDAITSRHSWVTTDITSFTGSSPNYTTTLVDLSDPPFYIKVS